MARRIDVREDAVAVYSLVDPRTGEVRYVGKTSDLVGRLAGHVSDRASINVREWVASLAADGVAPRMDVLCWVAAGQDVDVFESVFIQIHKAKLLNAAPCTEPVAPEPPVGHTGESVASRKLLEAVKPWGSGNALTRRIGCGQGLISRWSRGVVKPEFRWRLAIRNECGIPVEDWEQAPGI